MNVQSAQIIKTIKEKLPTENTPEAKKKLEGYWP